MPGQSIGTMITEMPRCRARFGIGAHAQPFVGARWAPLFQIFEPLITHSSPSRTARVRRLARSVPASGSE